MLIPPPRIQQVAHLGDNLTQVFLAVAALGFYALLDGAEVELGAKGVAVVGSDDTDIIATSFEEVSVVGVLANLVAVPLSGPILTLGLLGTLAGNVGTPSPT